MSSAESDSNVVAISSKEKYDKLQDAIERYKGMEGPLMPVLHEAQEIFGALSLDVQKYISEALNVPVMELYGVATFYSQFSLKPKGVNKVSVCMGTACYVRGAKKIQDKLEETLGIKVGETDKEGMFTLEATRCVGACGLSPVMLVNDDVYGRATSDIVPGIINKYKFNVLM